MNKNIDINIVLLNNDAKVPQKQHISDIGYDIYSVKQYSILPNEVTKVETGVSIELPDMYKWDPVNPPEALILLTAKTESVPVSNKLLPVIFPLADILPCTFKLPEISPDPDARCLKLPSTSAWVNGAPFASLNTNAKIILLYGGTHLNYI